MQFFVFYFTFLIGYIERNRVCVYAANWAQSSGAIKQNIVIPYYPSYGNPHWASRYGMTTIVVPGTGQGTGFVYLLGGDTYDGGNTSANIMNGQYDTRWENGYKNDIWKMAGTEWLVKGDPRLRSNHQKLPKVSSYLRWKLINSGSHPPPRTTYDKWIGCETYFIEIKKDQRNCSESNSYGAANAPMWSPRRHHAGLYFDNKLWIFGGRAREFVELQESRSVGGILNPRIRDIYDSSITALSKQLFTTQREVSVYKSDVWSSADGGVSWQLVTPGCHAPQASLIAAGNPVEGQRGLKSQQCITDADCYGAEVCGFSGSATVPAFKGVCVCSMWTSREQLAVAAYGEHMYVSGGYASQLFSQHTNCGPYACGDTDASAYRYYLSDLWRSKDGVTWELLTETAFNSLGRGGHQMLALERFGLPYLWVLGGSGGSNSWDSQAKSLVYYDDIWAFPINKPNGTWFLEKSNANNASLFTKWSARTGHAVALEKGTSSNLNVRTIYIYGGYNGTYLDDLWAWRLDDPNEFWRKDFTSAEYFATGDGNNLRYYNNSPAVNYIYSGSDLSLLQRYLVPTKFIKRSTGESLGGQRMQLKPYLTSERIASMNSVGIYTVEDLANIGLYTVLKLRGFDFPQVPKDQRLRVYEICDYRALAKAVVQKCALNLPSLYEGEKNMAWNNAPSFGGAPPVEDTVLWHGQKNYNYLNPESLTAEKALEQWNGCDYVESIEGLHGPNVPGLGHVQQVQNVKDPSSALENLFCKQFPGPRAFHQLVVFEERLYIMGGKQSDTAFYSDTWYRDAKMPTVRFGTIPLKRDTFPWFNFVSDKPGVFFEYRVYDPYNYKQIRAWSNCTRKTDIGWLDWRKNGPGNGLYRLYVRAVDPAGNRDEKFYWDQNVYEWYYVSPTPWDIIAEAVGGFIGLLILAYFEYRRRVKKAAMERYAMKRMRRKFKAMQRDINGKSVDWRTLYMEAKEAETGPVGGRKKTKETGKNNERREKEKQRREKEKEKIRKKLIANKDTKKKAKSTDDFADIMDDGDDVSAMSSTDGKSSRMKPGSTKKSSTNKKKKIAAIKEEVGYEEEEDELMLWEREAKVNTKAEKEKTIKIRRTGKGEVGATDVDLEAEIESGSTPQTDKKKKKPTTVNDAQTSRVLTNDREIGAGELRGSSGLEQGAKQRKTNKQFQASDGVEAEPINEAKKEKEL